ncbi:MAG: group II intron reverse transcriptase/maturase [Candidatus Obscuribacterales bacterium]|nr:group II intron reverse transcriptase/maturase [Candidatus Obscuribacterales bacterium]
MSTELERISKLARENRRLQFLSIAQYLNPAALLEAFRRLRKDASAGVDGIKYGEYQKGTEEKIQKLHERVRQKRYRAQPLRRVYIPKEDGKQRPLSIPSLEDKILQKATATLLNAIYEQDFYECSYGFRPGRSQHQALDAVKRTICGRPVGWLLEADISGYFDAIVRSQLMEMIERRVKDGSILRLICKWINVGVIDEGRLLTSETGTGQGQIISPLLANIYLHYVLDEWFETDVKCRLRGEAHEVRFADDFIMLFEYKEDAERVLRVLAKRFAKYGLTLHPEKTRLVEFGRSAVLKSETTGGKAPDTFDFLGFTHIATRSRRGYFTIHVRTMRKRLKRSIKAVKEWCEEHRHDSIDKQQRGLNKKLTGHYQYDG